MSAIRLRPLKFICAGLAAISFLAVPAICVLAADPGPDFAAADRTFLMRDKDEKAREGLQSFREIYKNYPASSEAAWRVGVGCYFVGLRLAKDGRARKELFREGRDASLAGVKLDDKCVPCHFWAATDMALYGQEVGIFKMFFSLGDIRKHLLNVVALEPAYSYGGAYRILGVIEQKLPGVLGGSNIRAIENFRKAIEASPDEPLNYLFLARIQQKKGDPEGARKSIASGLAVPTPSPERLESLESLDELKQLGLTLKTQ